MPITLKKQEELLQKEKDIENELQEMQDAHDALVESGLKAEFQEKRSALKSEILKLDRMLVEMTTLVIKITSIKYWDEEFPVKDRIIIKYLKHGFPGRVVDFFFGKE